jgi:hypothetical protein
MILPGCEDIFEKDISGDSVNIISPENNAIFTGQSIAIVWEELDGAEEYHVVIASPAFNNVLTFRDTITTETDLELSLPEGQYEWSLQASNFGYKSRKTVRSFEIKSNEE